jgi:restriction system protein
MSLWLIRAGKHGEHEQKFLDESRVYITWGGLNVDLSKLKDIHVFRQMMHEHYRESSVKKIINNASQLWPFVHEMKAGDLAVVPVKSKAAIHIAEISGDYVFNPSGPDPYFHYRNVKWVARDVPRQSFDQDLLYSFGAFMTICEVKRNDAERRVRGMAAGGWKSSAPAAATTDTAIATIDDADGSTVDLEQLAQDSIAKLIIAKFKGHGLARLVEAILKAQGYTTHLSPPGADKGVDILAAPDALGFGRPRLCVQVKSEQSPIERAVLDQLIGTMQNFNAEQGLLVSWGGFKQSVEKERAAQFFRVRLWDQRTLIEELVAHYDQLDEELRAEIPLKRMWTVAVEDEDDG